MSLLGSKTHTAGDTKQLILDYGDWLRNTAKIASITITSSSTSLTVAPTPQILGDEVIFSILGGNVGETATLTVVAQDSIGQVKNDTIAIIVVSP